LNSQTVNYIVLDNVGSQVQPDIFTIDSDNAVTIDFISPRTGTANIFRCIDQALVNTATSTVTSGTLESRGAVVTLTTTTGIENNSASTIYWDEVITDTDGFFNVNETAQGGSAFTIPAGITKVRLSAQGEFAQDSTGVRQWFMLKNGAFGDTRLPHDTRAAGTTGGNSAASLTSAAVDVTEGDVFVFNTFQNSGGTLNANPVGSTTRTWFMLEVLEPVTVTGIATGGTTGGGSATIDEGQVAFIAQIFG
jgi:hypothetical protein